MYLATIASTALFALFAAANAAAVLPSSSSQEGIIRLPLIRNENGQLASLKRDGLGKRATKASLYNAFGREYMIEVGVGTPAQHFNLTLDTGSAEFWIPSTGCSTTECPYGRFAITKSSTHKATTEPFSVEYGIGNAHGVYALDTVTLGTAKVASQKIALVSTTKDILGIVDSGEQSNGIMGLGYVGLNTVRGVSDDTPFVFNLAKTLQQPVFSIYLNSMFAYGSHGEIMFGGIDASKFSGSLQYVPVVKYDTSSYLVSAILDKKKTSSGGTYLYWTVAGQGIKATGYSASLPSLQGFILDTGTTLTMIPRRYADGIISAVAGPGRYAWDEPNGVYRVDCSIAKEAKTVDFEISRSTTAKSSNPVVISTPLSQLVIPLDTDYLDSATTCMFGISASPDDLTDGETWIIGEASLRSLYTVYNMGKNTVGLAPAKYITSSAVTTTTSSAAVKTAPKTTSLLSAGSTPTSIVAGAATSTTSLHAATVAPTTTADASISTSSPSQPDSSSSVAAADSDSINSPLPSDEVNARIKAMYNNDSGAPHMVVTRMLFSIAAIAAYILL